MAHATQNATSAAPRTDVADTVILGAGANTRLVVQDLVPADRRRIRAILDDATDLDGTSIAGIPVRLPLEATRTDWAAAVSRVIITSSMHEAALRERARSILGDHVEVETTFDSTGLPSLLQRTAAELDRRWAEPWPDDALWYAADRLYTDLRTRLEHLPTWRYGTARQCREWREVRSGLGRLDLAGCTVLDFGCGRYHPLGQSALAAASGAARTIALDVLPVVDARRAALATSELLGQTLLAPEAVLGAVAPPRSSVLARIERHFDLDRLAALRWHEARRGPCSYLVEPIEACSIEPESIDVVVSRDVVEHIGDVPAALSALRRLVGPGARLVLFIDFTDHRRYLDPGVYEHWSHLVDLDEPTHLATNRLRFPQYPPLFEAAGFRVTRWHPTASEPIPAAHAAGLAPPYRDMTTADLSVCGAVAVLEPAGT